VKLVSLIGTCPAECKRGAASEVEKIGAEAVKHILLARESCDDWLQQSADTAGLNRRHCGSTKCPWVILSNHNSEIESYGRRLARLDKRAASNEGLLVRR
jgi:hypothetical protein